MIRIMLGGYNDEQKEVLMGALICALGSLKCNKDVDCATCKNSRPCGDISSAVGFITKQAQQKPDVENPVENVEK